MIGAVLAGGRSRRMGASKAAVPLGGAPLIARPLAAAAAAGLYAVVVAKPATELPPLDVPVWREPAEPSHPLCGLVAALERGPVVAIACDQPWVTAELLRELAAHEGPVVAAAGEPFPGRYEPAQLPTLREALAREASLRATLELLAPASLGAPHALLASVNTREELAAAERALHAATAARRGDDAGAPGGPATASCGGDDDAGGGA